MASPWGPYLALFLGLTCFPTGCISVLVTVPETERYTMLFASVILRCDYSTSAPLQDVVVTWRFKSFCKDPILDYYSFAYQASLGLGQDPSNDCNDNQREVRIVAQKRGQNEPVLGVDYSQRKITIRNKADLVINEVMWWDHGVYYCAVEAPGDTSGDPDKEVKLIVLILERHEFMKQARQLLPWMAHHSQSSSYQLNPLLQREMSTHSSQPLMPPLPQMPHSNKFLDHLESELRNLNVSQPVLPSRYVGVSRQPSILSSLGPEIVERRVIQLPPLVEHIPSSQRSSSSSRPRRTIHTPRPRSTPNEEERPGSRRRRRLSLDEDFHSSDDQESWGRNREPRAERQKDTSYYDRSRSSRPGTASLLHSRNSLRSYPEEARRETSREQYSDRRYLRSERGPYRQSSDRRSRQRHRSYSPPSRRDSWSSSDESERLRRKIRQHYQHRSPDWAEDKPPSYTSVENGSAKGGINRSRTERQSEKDSSRSGRSVVL